MVKNGISTCLNVLTVSSSALRGRGAPDCHMGNSMTLSIYPDIQNILKDKIGISKENVLSAPQVKKGKVFTNDMGWRTIKGSYGVFQGKWYYEVSCRGESRVGWAQMSADLQSYPGYDRFGYSYSNRGELFHQAIGRVPVSYTHLTLPTTPYV